MTLYILLTTPTTDAGPFNLYSDTDGYVSAFATNVSKATLLSGYVAYGVPVGTTIVKLVSVGEECQNYIDVAVGGGPIPTTSTTTSTTTINPFTWYYGVYSSPGGVVPIPDENDINISTGTVVTAVDPSGPIIIPFNSAVDDFLWFAIPVTANGKTNWYVNPFNQGSVGGPATPFGNLFPEPIQIIYNSVPFYLYISTARTNVVQMTISGSTIITTTTSTTAPPPLSLIFDNISNANILVGDASDVADWNTFFDLPTYGNPFTSVQIVGNEVRLSGGSNIIVKDDLFDLNDNLIEIYDNSSIIEVGDTSFYGTSILQKVTLNACIKLTYQGSHGSFENSNVSEVYLPNVEIIDDYSFGDCISLSKVSIPSCLDLGSTVGDDNVFDGVISTNLNQIYYFSDRPGTVGYSIGDGGNDMYDGGNRIFANTNQVLYTHTQLNLNGPLNVGDYNINTSVINSSPNNFGSSASYFTNMYPGFFFMAAEGTQINEFKIQGDVGADGNGFLNYYNYSQGGYQVYVKRIGGTSDPSVNHIIIVNPSNSNLITQTVPNNTDDDAHTLTGLLSAGVNKIYYMVFAKTTGNILTNQEVTDIVSQFLIILNSSANINALLTNLNSNYINLTQQILPTPPLQIELVIPTALMTCNSGNPDGDIQYLQANNTVTIITV